MDVREKREKLEKLATLTSAQVQVMYYRCQDKTVSEITNILDLDNEGTVWARFTQIFKKLGVSGQEELVLQYSPIFLKYIRSEDDWKNWGHIRAAILDEAHTLSSQTTTAVESSLPSEVEPSRTEGESAETVETSAPSNLPSQIPRSQQNKTEKTGQVRSGRRIPWPLIAIPLVISGLLCIAGIAFGIPLLGNFIGRNTPTNAASETSGPLIQDTSTQEPSPIVQPTDTQVALPADTLTPTLTLTPTSTFTPTVTITPIPTNTKSPMGLGVGDELRDDRVTLKLIDVRWNEGYDRVSSLGRAPVSHVFEYANHSGETIVVQFDKSYFVVEDNTGRTAECWFFLSPYAAFKEWNSTLNDNDTVLITTRCGNGQIPEGVTSYALTVHPFTSLPESTWIIDVPR